MTGKRIVLSTFDSFGDVHPYVAIALELKARGHHPVIATSEVYREKMETLRLDFHPVRPDMPTIDQPEALADLMGRVMDQRKAGDLVAKVTLPYLRDIYADLDAVTTGADLLITHPLPLVGPMIAQKKRLPWISSVLAPASLLSAYDPVVPPQWPWLYHLMRLSPLVGRAALALAKPKLDKIMQPVYDLRRDLGLPRGEQPVFGGQHSPTKVLALFSKVLAQ